MSALTSVHRDEGDIDVIPSPSHIGLITFFVTPMWRLYARLPSVFWLCVIIAALVFTITVHFESHTSPLWIAMNRQQLSFSRTRGAVGFSHRPLHQRMDSNRRTVISRRSHR